VGRSRLGPQRLRVSRPWPSGTATHPIVTKGAISARVASPMPETSSSSSTAVKAPFSVRHVKMASAVTGPTPGRVSSSTWSAVFRFTSWPGRPDGVMTGADAAGAATPAGARIPTRICSPSTRTRARFSAVRFTLLRAPLAARRASATREPAGSVAMPGRRTLPAMSTMISAPPAGGLGAAAPGVCATTGEGPVTGLAGALPVIATSGEAVGTADGWATAGTTVPGPSALRTHHAATASAAATSRETTVRWAEVSPTLPWSVGGSRSCTHPPILPGSPIDRCACLPGAACASSTGPGKLPRRASGGILPCFCSCAAPETAGAPASEPSSAEPRAGIDRLIPASSALTSSRRRRATSATCSLVALRERMQATVGNHGTLVPGQDLRLWTTPPLRCRVRGSWPD